MLKGFLLVCLLISLNCFAISQDSLVDDAAETEDFFFIDYDALDSADVLTIWGIVFYLGKYDLIDPNDIRVLAIANYLMQHPSYIIEVGMHTDCRGSSHMCGSLSYRRAQTIVNRLIDLGIEADRLIAQGYGESRPYMDNEILLTCDYIAKFSLEEAEAMHQKNRRVEIRLISEDYMP